VNHPGEKMENIFQILSHHYVVLT